MNPTTDRRWQAVLEGESAYALALAQFAPDEMPDVLAAALGTLSGRRAALRILGDSPPSLTEATFPTLQNLLLVSHSMLAEARRVVCMVPRERLVDLLNLLTDHVVEDERADYEAYRRLAELLRSTDMPEPLRRLLESAAASEVSDIREIVPDFENDVES